MKNYIQNYINGNLSDAKRQARRVSEAAIIVALVNEYGYGPAEANAIAAYLKGRGSFQDAANAEYSIRK